MNSIANIYKAVFLLVASTLIVFAGVDLFYTILQLRSFASEYSPVSVQQEHPAVTGRGSASRAAVDYQVIVSRNLFGEVGAEFEDVQLADVENLQQTSLD
ncbi:MAG: hypothetical protein OEL66_10795, partial [Desulfobulbaceae bacterium]|nr:hypothetical protein [Desulfobulbaceae bacterium]